MKKKQLSIVAIALLCAMGVNAQVGINTSAPDKSAALDVYYKVNASDTPKGFLPPKMTTSERGQITEPAKGLVIYNTTVDSLQYNFGTPASPQWANAGGGGGATSGATTKATDWFYMPVTPINTASASPQTVDLYTEYKRQFTIGKNTTGNANVPSIYDKTAIEFYILGYDTNAFSALNITKDGILTYTAIPSKVTKASYLNVIIKILK